MKPNDVDAIVNSNSVFVASRSSLIRQLESLNDLCEKNLGPPWKYVPWSEKVNYFELVDLLVAELDRRFGQPRMNKLFVTGYGSDITT